MFDEGFQEAGQAEGSGPNEEEGDPEEEGSHVRFIWNVICETLCDMGKVKILTYPFGEATLYEAQSAVSVWTGQDEVFCHTKGEGALDIICDNHLVFQKDEGSAQEEGGGWSAW